MFDNTDNTGNENSADTIIATCPECNEPIYNDETVKTGANGARFIYLLFFLLIFRRTQQQHHRKQRAKY